MKYESVPLFLMKGKTDKGSAKLDYSCLLDEGIAKIYKKIILGMVKIVCF